VRAPGLGCPTLIPVLAAVLKWEPVKSVTNEAVEHSGLPDGASALRKPKTILIADDSDVVRGIVRESLERETGCTICGEATNGADAISKARELAPDLIILDVRMPRLNGIEVAAILRHAMPNLRIILISMFADDLGQKLTSALHVDASLSKSDGIAKLIASVKNLLAD
jgi:DNA-binding NarL/FixJ family response regulator